jgi:hypothetical protein
MSEAFGGNWTHRGDGSVLKRVCCPLRFRSQEMGWVKNKARPRFVHARRAKLHAALGNWFESTQAARAAATALVWAEWHARANAKNKARENGLSRALCSGCHCTPTTNLASGRLTASICPSGAMASTRSPGAGRSIPCECNELTITSATPASDARSPPLISATLCAGPYGPSGESLRER